MDRAQGAQHAGQTEDRIAPGRAPEPDRPTLREWLGGLFGMNRTDASQAEAPAEAPAVDSSFVDQLLESQTPRELLSQRLESETSSDLPDVSVIERAAQERWKDSQHTIAGLNAHEELRLVIGRATPQGSSSAQMADMLFKELLSAEREAGTSLDSAKLLELAVECDVAEDAVRAMISASLEAQLNRERFNMNGVDLLRAAEARLQGKDHDPREGKLAILQEAFRQALAPASPLDQERVEIIAELALNHITAQPHTQEQAEAPIAPPAPTSPAPSAPPAPAPATPEIDSRRQIAISQLGHNGVVSFEDGDGNMQSVDVRKLAKQASARALNRSHEALVRLVAANIIEKFAERGLVVDPGNPAQTYSPNHLAEIEVSRLEGKARSDNFASALASVERRTNVFGVGDIDKLAARFYSSPDSNGATAKQVDALAKMIRENEWAPRRNAALSQEDLVQSGSKSRAQVLAVFGAAGMDPQEQLEFSRLVAAHIISTVKRPAAPSVKPAAPRGIAEEVASKLADPETAKEYNEIARNAAGKAIHTRTASGSIQLTLDDKPQIVEHAKQLILAKWTHHDVNTDAYAAEFARQAVEAMYSPRRS